MSKDGYILTNYHVVMEDSLAVITKGGEKFKPELVRVNKSADLALLKIDSNEMSEFRLRL